MRKLTINFLIFLSVIVLLFSAVSFDKYFIPRYTYELRLHYMDDRPNEIVYIISKSSIQDYSKDWINLDNTVYNRYGESHYYNVYKVDVIKKTQWYNSYK